MAQSQESSSSSSTENMGTFVVGSTKTSPFVLEDLLRAPTKILGKGTAAVAYRSELKSKYTVVIKRWSAADLPKEEFDLRFSVIDAIRDKYIAPLLWYHWSNNEMMLLYNYFPMGSLAHALHDPALHIARMGWEQRAAIALAAARGVAYIHSTGPSSYHGNIKSSNVMLTGTHGACVSEHGLITLGVFSNPSVYCAPEVIDDMLVSQEADVYSFGVLLMELLTRKTPVKSRHHQGVDLPRWVRSVAKHSNRHAVEVIDVQLLAEKRNNREEECMVRLLQLAIHCCSEDANSRPTMSDVVQQIEKMQA